MKELKFKVGDRVLATDNLGIHTTPSPGTIVSVSVIYHNPYRVEYDNHPKALLWSTVHGYYKPKKQKPKKQPVIVITSDGKTTTATKRLGKKVICSATARCSDDDTFDFNTGAELAFRRLREKEKPVPKEKPWPKKLVCVEANAYPEDFGVGRVYLTEWTTRDFGLLHLKDGTSWGIVRTSDTEFRVNLFSDTALFIPLVED